MDILPSVAGNRCTVFISPSGDGNYYNLILSHRRHQLLRIRNCMGTLDRTDDTLGSCEVFKSFYCLIVRYRNVFGAADVMQICMLRSNAG